MKVYIVYRVEHRTNKTVRIGKVVDHRRAEQNNNAADMLRVAQKLYAASSIDSRIFIIRESSRLRLLFEDPMASPATAGSGSRSSRYIDRVTEGRSNNPRRHQF